MLTIRMLLMISFVMVMQLALLQMLMLLILSEDLEPCWASMVRVVVDSSVSHINAEVE